MALSPSNRLEQIPLSRIHFRIWLVAALGFLFEGLDLTIVGGVLAVLITVFHINDATTGLLGSIALAGYVVGVALAGWIGDRYGRKFVMQYTLLLFTVMTILTAFSWNAGSFGVFRFLTGIGVGGESAIVTPYLAELMPRLYRGRFLGTVDALYTVGGVLAAALNLAVIPLTASGWRFALIIAGLPAVYVWVIRKSLPESPRWLMSQGRTDEANDVVTRIERAAGVQPGASPASPPVTPAQGSSWATFFQIWQSPLALRTGLIWISWFFIELVYYGFLVWLPSLLVKHGFTILKSLEYNFLIYLAALVGGVGASFLQDTPWGRKVSIVAFLLLSGAASYLFAISATNWAILGAAAALSLLLNGVFSMLYTFTPEQYPTEVRATGQGFASAFGHVGGVVGPLLVGFTLGGLGMHGIFILFALFLIVPVLTILGLRESRGLPVEEAAAPSPPTLVPGRVTPRQQEG